MPAVTRVANFYPRSPCGERRVTVLGIQHKVGISIHALLAESDLRALPFSAVGRYFYPRSPCGERPPSVFLHCTTYLFLSTLSLRRATVWADSPPVAPADFYPRSPCGERPDIPEHQRRAGRISIHALLAESDGVHYDNYNLHCVISIHALLAESDV